jgi:hypothetical protein
MKTCQCALTTFKESAIQNATKFSHPHWRRSGSTVGRIQNAGVSVMSSYGSEVRLVWNTTEFGALQLAMTNQWT